MVSNYKLPTKFILGEIVLSVTAICFSKANIERCLQRGDLRLSGSIIRKSGEAEVKRADDLNIQKRFSQAMTRQVMNDPHADTMVVRPSTVA